MITEDVCKSEIHGGLPRRWPRVIGLCIASGCRKYHWLTAFEAYSKYCYYAAVAPVPLLLGGLAPGHMVSASLKPFSCDLFSSKTQSALAAVRVTLEQSVRRACHWQGAGSQLASPSWIDREGDS